jgi:hypothetical protein
MRSGSLKAREILGTSVSTLRQSSESILTVLPLQPTPKDHTMLKPRSRRPGRKSLRFESLEDRVLLAGDSFNDPDYTTIQWGLYNTGQNGGRYDIDIDAPEAWTITTRKHEDCLRTVG